MLPCREVCGLPRWWCLLPVCTRMLQCGSACTWAQCGSVCKCVNPAVCLCSLLHLCAPASTPPAHKQPPVSWSTIRDIVAEYCLSMLAGEKKKKDPVSRPQQLHSILAVSSLCHAIGLSHNLLCLEPTACPVLGHFMPTCPRSSHICCALPWCMHVNSVHTTLQCPPQQLHSPCTTLRSPCWPAECPQAGNLSLHVLQSRQACRGEQHACAPLYRVVVGAVLIRPALLQKDQPSPLSGLISAVSSVAASIEAPICT